MKKNILILFLLVSLTSFSQTKDTINLGSGIVAEWVEPEIIFPPIDTNKLSNKEIESIESDKAFIKSLPATYDNIPPDDLKNLVSKFEDQIEKLIAEKEALLKSGANPEVIESKALTINSLNKEKSIVNLTIEKDDLIKETDQLEIAKKRLKSYLTGAGIGIALLVLLIVVMLQRKAIKGKDNKIENQLDDINRKNKYLEYASRIIRHDMHSGINTYIPRGISSLEKKVSEDQLRELKIDGSVKMIKDGLDHTQKVYKSVYEFTNLVKPNSILEKSKVDLKTILLEYVSNTAYVNQVEIGDLISHSVNSSLFCTAIDNLIRNGLKYNQSTDKKVKISFVNGFLLVEDNGVGLSNTEFENIIKNKKQTGLGLSIALAILEEHGFKVYCEEIGQGGTRIKIKI